MRVVQGRGNGGRIVKVILVYDDEPDREWVYIIGAADPAPVEGRHAALDAAVPAAYGFSVKGDLLKQLLDLNHAAAAERAGQPVIAPGVPAVDGDPAGLLTDDCIGPG